MIPLSLWSINILSENILLLCSILFFAAVLVTKVGARFGVPSLLLFLLLGMAVGRDGLGLIFEDYEIAESIGHLAMTIILLSAGLETSFVETKPILKAGTVLSTLGIMLTVIIAGGFIYLAFGNTLGVSLLGALMLAAIMGSTDSASVFSILRSKKMHLRENLGPMLELESGSNDPVAYSLTIIFVQCLVDISSGASAGGWHIVLSSAGILVMQIAVGLAVGIATGYASEWLISNLKLPGSALYSIMILSVGFFANGIAELLHGNGLLALYVAAIIFGNKATLPHRKEVLSFFNGMTWLMQLVMFLILGLLARPSIMLDVLLPALLIGLFIMFVARPAGVMLSLHPFGKLSFRAKMFVSWVGIKGAGPILFALCPVVVGLEGSSEMFNLVFIITLMSLLLQGMTLGPVAHALKLSYDLDPPPETFGMEIPSEMGMLRDHTVSKDDLSRGSTLRDLNLPHGIRVMMVRRGDSYLVPHGSMLLEEGDRLVIIIGDSDD